MKNGSNRSDSDKYNVNKKSLFRSEEHTSELQSH